MYGIFPIGKSVPVAGNFKLHPTFPTTLSTIGNTVLACTSPPNNPYAANKLAQVTFPLSSLGIILLLCTSPFWILLELTELRIEKSPNWGLKWRKKLGFPLPRKFNSALIVMGASIGEPRDPTLVLTTKPKGRWLIGPEKQLQNRTGLEKGTKSQT